MSEAMNQFDIFSGEQQTMPTHNMKVTQDLIAVTQSYSYSITKDNILMTDNRTDKKHYFEMKSFSHGGVDDILVRFRNAHRLKELHTFFNFLKKFMSNRQIEIELNELETSRQNNVNKRYRPL